VSAHIKDQKGARPPSLDAFVPSSVDNLKRKENKDGRVDCKNQHKFLFSKHKQLRKTHTHVERRHGEDKLVSGATRQRRNVLVERDAVGSSSGPADGHRHGQDGVGAELFFAGSPFV
jgi:hypothetical protein